MLSKPSKVALENSSPYKNFVNQLSLSISSAGIEETIKKKDSQIKSYEVCPVCKVIICEKFVKAVQNKCEFCDTKLAISNSALNQLSSMNEDQAYNIRLKEVSHLKASTSVLIVICLDYSGSMNMSYIPKEGSIAKGFLKKKPIPPEYKEYINEYTDISRKELLLLHIERKLRQLFDSNDKYDYKVFVITFANELCLYGNGTKQNYSVKMDPSYFENLDQCINFGMNNALKVFEKNKENNLEYLIETLQKKEADGQTSLGPAIACGLGVIEAIKPDLSQFYIFTDGVANVGLGDMTSSEAESKMIFGQLADLGLTKNVGFHIFGFENENSKLSILQELLKNSNDGQLERIITPVIKEEKKDKIYGYDEVDFEKKLEAAFKVSAKTYGILSKLKVFSNARIKFCMDSKSNLKEKKVGNWKVWKKIIGNITEEENTVCMRYDFERERENHFVQIQLTFIITQTGERKMIVINDSSIVVPNLDYKNVNLKVANRILINDNFEKNNELYGPYLDFLFECKYLGDSERVQGAINYLKQYMIESYPKNKKSNESNFEKAEQNIRERIEAEKNQNKKQIQKQRSALGKNIVANNYDSSSDDEKTITRRRVKKKAMKFEEEDTTNKKENFNEKKKEEVKREDDDEMTIVKKKYLKNTEEDASEMTKVKKKGYGKKEEVKKEDSDNEMTFQKKSYGKKK